MLRKFKYDIAISVAEEDLHVAKAIASCLKPKDISYYLYTDDIGIYWGENLFKISYDMYSGESKYVLIIISETYIRKHWADIERQISQTVSKAGSTHILPLRLDDTPVDGLSRNTIFIKWNNNPHEIADTIEAKLRHRQQKAKSSMLRLLAIFSLLVTGYAGSRIVVKRQKTKQEPSVTERHDSARKNTDTTTFLSVHIPVNDSVSPSLPVTDSLILPAGVEQLPPVLDNAEDIPGSFVDITGNNSEIKETLSKELYYTLAQKGFAVDSVYTKGEKLISLSFTLNSMPEDMTPESQLPNCAYEFTIFNPGGNILKTLADRFHIPLIEGLPDIQTIVDKMLKQIIHELDL